MTLILIGSRVEIENVAELSKFGQSVDVEDALAHEILLKGTLVTQEQFDSVGFTEEELEANKESWRHEEATVEFKEKKNKAKMIAHRNMLGSVIVGDVVVHDNDDEK